MRGVCVCAGNRHTHDNFRSVHIYIMIPDYFWLRSMRVLSTQR